MRKNNASFFHKVKTFLYDSNEGFLKSHLFYLLIFSLTFISVQNHVFKKEIDINGDNAWYYIGAKSIDQGDGYADIMSIDKPKTNNFPPGYPFLMSLVMKISDSFVAQKIFNSVLLGIACFLLYLIVFRFTSNKLLSLTAALLPSFNYLILHFNSMMMSETSFIAFSVLSIYAVFKLYNVDNLKKILKDPYFYVLVISSTYAYHIRTQGISLIAAFFIYFLIRKRWKQGVLYALGCVFLALPWIIRNKVAGVGSSRYLNKILAVNHWRPEEGLMSFGGLIKRMLSTSEMLITKAIPNSIIPNYMVDYNADSSILMWTIGISVIVIIVWGLWHYFKSDMLLFITYIVFSCGIIALWSAPSGNRYLVSIVPFLQIGLLMGIIAFLKFITQKINFKVKQENIFLVVVILISSFSFSSDIKRLKSENSRGLHPAYKNYFTIAESLKKKFPKGDVVVCSRKRTLFYLHSGCYSTGFKSSLNDTLVVKGLVENDVEYVVLDQLGYSSTARYLYPAIQKNPELFKPVLHLKNPDTYLLWFDKKKAENTF